MSQSEQTIEQTGVLAENYARALFELAQEAGSVDEVAQELGELVELTGAYPELGTIFSSRIIDTQRRSDSLKRMFEGKVLTLTYNFLQVLNQKGRLDQLAVIRYAFGQQVKVMKGEIDVEVYTATALSSDQLEDVATRVSSALGKTALIQSKIDETLIGGLKLKIGDKLIDASVASQLRKFGRDVKRSSHEAIRKAVQEMNASND